MGSHAGGPGRGGVQRGPDGLPGGQPLAAGPPAMGADERGRRGARPAHVQHAHQRVRAGEPDGRRPDVVRGAAAGWVHAWPGCLQGVGHCVSCWWFVSGAGCEDTLRGGGGDCFSE